MIVANVITCWMTTLTLGELSIIVKASDSVNRPVECVIDIGCTF
jgi:hypothetical protein